jgi:hypothetical protein
MDSANRAAAAVHSPESTSQTLKPGSGGAAERGRFAGQGTACCTPFRVSAGALPTVSSFATLPHIPGLHKGLILAM